MLTPPTGLKVFVATKPVDFRKGADGLALFAKDVLGQDPLSGVALVFRAKRADRVKILAWDGSGLVLYWKRLENGAFKWPSIVDGVMRMNAAQLAALLSGSKRCCVALEMRLDVGHSRVGVIDLRQVKPMLMPRIGLAPRRRRS
jgi:transposase